MQLKPNCLLLALALVTSASAQGIHCSQLGGTCGGFAGIPYCGDAFCGGLDPNVADAADLLRGEKWQLQYQGRLLRQEAGVQDGQSLLAGKRGAIDHAGRLLDTFEVWRQTVTHDRWDGRCCNLKSLKVE
ncbi:hypothetical protein DFH08DRAFT_799741 [Mycena albidolilacea]|uniref:Uncharacterized protein n=1 Tax=Mycena albidolilacea TaxID=1033008 RepID=A0AAD7AME3_9AGAR|nr:hypothetical protein DFH08DRAFT_799741 [Mycena albidolilacea]